MNGQHRCRVLISFNFPALLMITSQFEGLEKPRAEIDKKGNRESDSATELELGEHLWKSLKNPLLAKKPRG